MTQLSITLRRASTCFLASVVGALLGGLQQVRRRLGFHADVQRLGDVHRRGEDCLSAAYAELTRTAAARRTVGSRVCDTLALPQVGMPAGNAAGVRVSPSALVALTDCICRAPMRNAHGASPCRLQGKREVILAAAMEPSSTAASAAPRWKTSRSRRGLSRRGLSTFATGSLPRPGARSTRRRSAGAERPGAEPAPRGAPGTLWRRSSVPSSKPCTGTAHARDSSTRTAASAATSPGFRERHLKLLRGLIESAARSAANWHRARRSQPVRRPSCCWTAPGIGGSPAARVTPAARRLGRLVRSSFSARRRGRRKPAAAPQPALSTRLESVGLGDADDDLPRRSNSLHVANPRREIVAGGKRALRTTVERTAPVSSLPRSGNRHREEDAGAGRVRPLVAPAPSTKRQPSR